MSVGAGRDRRLTRPGRGRRAPASLLALVLAFATSGCGNEDAPAAPSAPSGKAAGERLDPVVRAPDPSGAAVTVAYRLEDGLVLRTRGTCAFRQTATGKPEPGKPLPANRSFSGSVDLARHVVAGGGAFHSRVEGFLRIESQEGPGPALPDMIPLSMTFEDDGRGGGVHRTVRKEAKGVDAADLEPLWGAFVERFAPPDRAVRAGDRFDAKEAMDLDDVLVRPTWMLFQRAIKGQPMLPRPTGEVWVEAVEGTGADAAVVLKAAIRHEHEGPTDPPPVPRDTVRVAYRAVIDATRRIPVGGGWAATHDLVLRRAYRFKAPAFDYLVETEESVRLETTRGR